MHPNRAVHAPQQISHRGITVPSPVSLDQRVAELAAAIRGEAPAMDLLGGACARAIDRAMLDNDSYELVDSTPPVIDGLYWIVEMTFRHKHRLGPKALQTKRFYLQQGQVVRIDTID